MKAIRICCCILVPATASALEPDIRWDHQETFREAYDDVQIRFPGGTSDCKEQNGSLDVDMFHHVFEIVDDISNIAVIDEVERQLGSQGFLPILKCTDSICGGFDFLRCMMPPPPPEMFVDLGNFRFLAALRNESSGPVMAMAMVSRTSSRVYLEFREARPSGQIVFEDLPEAPVGLVDRPMPFLESLTVNGYAVLEDLVFTSGSPELGDAANDVLTELADYLKNRPIMSAILVGHTDADGTLENNIDLSKRRAEAVYRHLVEDLGVAAGQLTTEGVGFLSPRAENRSDEGRIRNRRVEVVIVPPR